MGCDIHAYIEYEAPGEDWITCFCSLHLDRNYSLFAALAGVRGGFPKIPPRGMPKNTSLEVADELAFWNKDAHSHSWLSPWELMDVTRDVHSIQIDALLNTMRFFPNSRLVFWFDN